MATDNAAHDVSNRPGMPTQDPVGRRPMAVYVVMAIGVLALLVLLMVIYFSSDRNIPRQPICTAITLDDARNAVLDGRVDRITIAYDDTVTEATDPNWGPMLAQVWFTDGQCGNVPEGVRHQADTYELLGIVSVYNDITENTQVDVNYDRDTTLSPSLYATPTAAPTSVPTVTPTVEPTPAATSTEVIPPVQGPPMPIGSPTP